MRLTGERPLEGQTPDSLLALHAAGYREVRERIGPGRFLDLGCGVGTGTAGFAGADRMLVGLDYDPETAAEARRRHRDVDLVTVCGDGSALPLRDATFDDVCSSHLIEHFVEPEHHVREVSRVLDDDGAAFFLTPNAPADFENPYHVHLFEPDDLRSMLGRHFGSVSIIGLDCNEVAKADFARRRAMAGRLLALDPLGLRHKLPRSWFVALHAGARRVAYPLISRTGGTEQPALTVEDWFTTDDIDETTMVLLAVAEKPIR